MQDSWINDLEIEKFKVFSVSDDVLVLGNPSSKVHKTHCQDECRSLSGGVPKNLTLHWMKKYFFFLPS